MIFDDALVWTILTAPLCLVLAAILLRGCL